jgi:hypothetical protein
VKCVHPCATIPAEEESRNCTCAPLLQRSPPQVRSSKHPGFQNSHIFRNNLGPRRSSLASKVRTVAATTKSVIPAALTSACIRRQRSRSARDRRSRAAGRPRRFRSRAASSAPRWSPSPARAARRHRRACRCSRRRIQTLGGVAEAIVAERQPFEGVAGYVVDEDEPKRQPAAGIQPQVAIFAEMIFPAWRDLNGDFMESMGHQCCPIEARERSRAETEPRQANRLRTPQPCPPRPVASDTGREPAANQPIVAGPK